MVSKLEKLVNKGKDLVKETKKYVGIGLLAGAFTFAPTPAIAQNYSILGGFLRSPGSNTTVVVQEEYKKDLSKTLSKPISISFSYINEGHLDDPYKHHRDGFMGQLWGDYSPKILDKLTLSAGVGPYYYYDTQSDEPNLGSTHRPNKFVRDFALVGSINAKYNLPYGLNIQGRVNFIEPTDNPLSWNNNDTDPNKNVSSQSFLLGIGADLSSENTGYLFNDKVKEKGKNQISFETVYSIGDIKNFVKAVEYRRIFTKNLEGSASYFFNNEGSYGAAAQVWLVENIKNLKFGIGTGAYFDLLSKEDEDTSNKEDLSQMISTMISYQITDHFNIQNEWSRIHPNRDKKEDIVRVGLGITF
jgi:hypothetical protein